MVRGTGKKGITPVIAVLLLIALTIAAVGMVAVILGTVTPAGVGLNAVLATDRVENNQVDEMKVSLVNWGPDAIQAGSISIELEGMYMDTIWCRGSAESLPDAGAAQWATISWVTATPPDMTAAQWPWRAGSGTKLVIIYKGADAIRFKPTSLTIKDATTGTVIYQDKSLSAPTHTLSPTPDFGISVSPTSGTIAQGDNDTAAISVTSIEGYDNTVTLDNGPVPDNVEISFVPSSGTPSFGSTMTVVVGVNAPTGTYDISIIGTGSDGTTHSCTYTLTVDNFLYEVQRRSALYFWEQANSANGLIKDRSTADSPCSISAVGFGLTSLCVSAEHGWLDNNAVYDRVLTTLRFFRDNVEGENGFFYHFVDMDTGARVWDSEVSLMDTAIFMAGALTAGEYFEGTEVDTLARDLYENAQWDWFLQPSGAMAASWTPEDGFSGERGWYWGHTPWGGGGSADHTGYDEYILAYLLALGSPTYPIPENSWDVWASTYEWVEYGDSGEFLTPGGYMRPTAYLYHFPASWIDFRNKHDAYADYWSMMDNALKANRQYCLDWAENYPDYDNNLWGWTACDGPDGYLGYDDFQGTVAPSAVAGSVPWMPELAYSELNYMYNTYGENIWGEYGFKDSFDSGYNSGAGWHCDDYVGINKGPEVLLIEDHRSGLVWNTFMQSPYINDGLTKAGFT